MMARTRRLAIAAGTLAGAMLVAEPGVRTTRQLNAAQWQLHWGSEFNYCEGCCGAGFCCTVGYPCKIIIE